MAELSDAGGPARLNRQLTWPARVRSSDFFIPRLNYKLAIHLANSFLVRCPMVWTPPRLIWDFPFGFLPATSAGLFLDFLPARQICKSFFYLSSHRHRFFPARGGAPLRFGPFHTLFDPTRRHLLRCCDVFLPSSAFILRMRLPIAAAQSLPESRGTTRAAPPPPPSGRRSAGNGARPSPRS